MDLPQGRGDSRGAAITWCSAPGKIRWRRARAIPTRISPVNNEEETLVLSTLAGELVDRVTVSGVGRDMSYGRDPESLR